MGYGDALMAAGAAERIYIQDSSRGPVAIVSAQAHLRWNPVWTGNPAVYQVQPNQCRIEDLPASTRTLQFGHDCLPYFPPVNLGNGLKRWPSDWHVRDHRPSLYLTDAERYLGIALRDAVGPFILLEPSGKDRKSPNRTWPLGRWQNLVWQLKQTTPYALVQLARAEANLLSDVHHIPHKDFRQAAGVLDAARLTVMTEGGLSIAAGALRRPAVVLLSPCGPPVSVVGFPEHTHVIVGEDDPRTPCGYMTPCQHCAAAWERLAIVTVVDAVSTALNTPAVVAGTKEMSI